MSDFTDDEIDHWASDDPYDSTHARKLVRRLAIALRAERAEVERLRAIAAAYGKMEFSPTITTSHSGHFRVDL